jgi:hypothetical protein
VQADYLQKLSVIMNSLEKVKQSPSFSFMVFLVKAELARVEGNHTKVCFVLFCFVLFCFVLFCFVLFCFVLFCFVLFC